MINIEIKTKDSIGNIKPMHAVNNTDIISECLKGYYPFRMFNELYKLKNCVAVECDTESFNACAAVSDDKSHAAVMVSYFDDNDNAPLQTAQLTAYGYTKAEIYLLDAEHDMECVGTQDLSNDRLELEFPLFGTYLVKLEK